FEHIARIILPPSLHKSRPSIASAPCSGRSGDLVCVFIIHSIVMLSGGDFDEPDEPPEPDEILHEEDDDDNDGGDDMILDDSTDEEEFVEFDPSGRYGRYSEVLGKGAMKTVYRGYDMTDCKEVAWNKARPPIECSDEQAVAVQREIHILQGLHHPGILKLGNAWVNDTGDTNFITELCSTTLLEYRLKHTRISRKAVKSWGRQILKGLAYLHMQDPPIIHRDLKCENILVKCRSDTALKIGDFGAATFLDKTHHMHTLVGTPEFMAPEMFQEDYNELVDVYSFGMCMLEILTRECPYSECKSLGQIYKKVINGEKPKALLKVTDMQAQRLINRCLLPACKRPSASELLTDPFLQFREAGCTSSGQSIKASASMPNLKTLTSNIGVKNMLSGQGIVNKLARPSASTKSVDHAESVDHDLLVMKSKDCVPRKAICTKSPSFRRTYRVTGRVEDQYTLRLKIRIQESSRSCDIHFPFDLRFDSPMSVAEEMVRTLDYSESDLATITDLIREEIAALIPGMEERFVMPASPEMTFQGPFSELCEHNESTDVGLSSISSTSWELSCNANEIGNKGFCERLLSSKSYGTAEEEPCRKASDDCNAEFSASSEDGGSTTTVFTCEGDSWVDNSSDSMELISENDEEQGDSMLPEGDSITTRDSTNSLPSTLFTEQASFASKEIKKGNECNSLSNNTDVAVNAALEENGIVSDDCGAFRRKNNRLVLFGSRQSPPHCTSKSPSRFKQLPAGIGILLRPSEQGLRRARPSCINASA
ncbi:hypothetical protein GOP47_0003513, partial [Adiantum capillus-veneris]